MAGQYDSEQQRIIDRIKCIAFREARDSGAEFINRNWIAQKLNRSVRWVTDNWNKTADDCFTEFGPGGPLKLSQESKNIIESGNRKQRKSNRQMAAEIFQKRGRTVSRYTIRRYRHQQGLKPFHVIAKP